MPEIKQSDRKRPSADELYLIKAGRTLGFPLTLRDSEVAFAMSSYNERRAGHVLV